jgi:hypothetical protein
MIFRAIITREIGLKSAGVSRLSILGIKVIKDVLMLWRSRFPA